MNEEPPLVLRPDRRTYFAWSMRPDRTVLVIVGGLMVTALASWAIGYGSDRAIVFLVLAVLVLCSALGALTGVYLSMRTSSVTIDDSWIVHHRWFVRRTSLSRDGLRGILCGYRPPLEHRSSLRLVLQNSSARGPRIRLNGAFWDTADLQTIALAAGVPFVDRELRAWEVERKLPGILRFHERRPLTVVLVTPLMVIALAFVASLILVVTRMAIDGEL